MGLLCCCFPLRAVLRTSNDLLFFRAAAATSSRGPRSDDPPTDPELIGVVPSPQPLHERNKPSWHKMLTNLKQEITPHPVVALIITLVVVIVIAVLASNGGSDDGDSSGTLSLTQNIYSPCHYIEYFIWVLSIQQTWPKVESWSIICVNFIMTIVQRVISVRTPRTRSCVAPVHYTMYLPLIVLNVN